MKIDLKSRFRNRVFVASFISTILLLLSQLGLGHYIPENMMDIINTVLVLLSMLGVFIDPTTEGIADNK